MGSLKVGYARVSSKQQADTDALNQQIDRLQKCGVEKLYIDVESGRKESRKGINQLFADIKLGKVREVVATRIDRLGRNVIAIHRAIETFQKAGIKLTILDSPLGDTNSAFGWLTINNIAGLAEFESRLLSERSRHGMNYYRQNRRYYKPPMGYIKDENGHLIPDPDKWDLMREVVNRLQTYSFGNISKWLYEEKGVKIYGSSIYKWVINPALRGHTFYNLPDGAVEKHYNTHQALITEEEYDAIVNHSRKKYRKDSHTNKKVHFLSGLIYCGFCGVTLCKSGNYAQNTAKFQCTSYRKFGKTKCHNGKSISLSVADRIVIAEIVKHAQSMVEIIREESGKSKVRSQTSEQAKITNELKQLESLQIKNPHIDAAIADLKTQLKLLETNESTAVARMEDEYKLLHSLTQADFVSSLSPEELRGIAGKLLDRIEYFGSRDLRCFFKYPSGSS